MVESKKKEFFEKDLHKDREVVQEASIEVIINNRNVWVKKRTSQFASIIRILILNRDNSLHLILYIGY